MTLEASTGDRELRKQEPNHFGKTLGGNPGLSRLADDAAVPDVLPGPAVPGIDDDRALFDLLLIGLEAQGRGALESKIDRASARTTALCSSSS